jgi:hypothetical protein
VEGNAEARKPLKMDDRWDHSFPAEAIQRPKQDKIKLALHGIVKEFAKGRTFGGPPALSIDVLSNKFVAIAPCSQLAELVLRVLALIFGRNAGVDRNPHGLLRG